MGVLTRAKTLTLYKSKLQYIFVNLYFKLKIMKNDIIWK